MPRPAPKSKKRHPVPNLQSQQREVVDPVWLAKAIGLTLIAALVCAYGTFCLLFYQGQWQLVLHPTRTSIAPRSIAGAPYELIHFGPDESAMPQLTGWWIPAQSNGHYSDVTLLFLPGADGSLVDSISTLAALHGFGINIFAFDYRGYGMSAATHPDQQKMTHDAEAAWLYLTTSRHVLPSQIVVYGAGVGASLAAQLAGAHAAIPAVVLDDASGDLLDAARHDPRSHLIPVRLLFHERFPLAVPLKQLNTPKLLLYTAGTSSPPAAFRTASDPKFTVELPARTSSLYGEAITRFLDQYLKPTGPVSSAEPSGQNPH